MATSLPPQRKKPLSEDQIEAIINRGGAAPTAAESVEKPEKTEEDADKPKFFTVRLTAGILDRVDRLREKRPRKPGSPKLGVSTNDWIVEAVLEKLERDGAKKK